jgi:glycyl-tRNA synthetase beta chain
MPELLFELGCEELPASAVRRAYEQLRQEIVVRLGEAMVGHGGSDALGTPRRLIVRVEDVAERQPDLTKEMRGPALKAAFGPDGAPTPALLGFCRGQGVDPEHVRRDGDYVWVDKHVPGRPSGEVLAEVLPAAVRALVFDKTMRWGASRMRFARPIRWILAAFGGERVPFEIEGVESGLTSRGHRFNHPAPFEARTFAALVEGLRAREVEPDPAVRAERIRAGARRVASGEPDLSDALVEENVFLTEWPEALEGEFRAEFMELPEPVLVTAMAKHERFFPVRGPNGLLLNRFVSIRNGGVDEVVREGNAWVLNARFNDAKFFYDEDAKRSMDDFLAATERMTFQERLGSVRQRSERLGELAAFLAGSYGFDRAGVEDARQAGLYAKADLSCGLVGELPALQGVIGAAYALRDGFSDPVAQAIGGQYDLARNLPLDQPGRQLGAIVLAADQIDKLAGYLGIGIAPSGSSDPFGLRRAVSLLVEVAWAWPGPRPGYLAAFHQAIALYGRQGIAIEEATATLADQFLGRYEALLGHEVRHDVLAGAVGAGANLLDPRQIRLRAECLALAATDSGFVQTATRPLNIVAAAEKKGIPFEKTDALREIDHAVLGSPEGETLAQAMVSAREKLEAGALAESADRVIEALRELENPINAFFEATMVMVDDFEQRTARLNLLSATCEMLLVAGDFTKLEV